MKKTKAQIVLMKHQGIRWPKLWNVVMENDHFIHARCWLTGENRIIRK